MSFKSLLRPLANRAVPIVERGWSRLIAAIDRVSAPAWNSSGGNRVLVVAPHPDDETIGCSGAILEHIAAGDSVTIAIVTDGRRSRALSDPDHMARVRQAEAQRAFELLGAQQLEWLGLAEGEWRQEALVPPLATLIDTLAPHIIYAPSRVDFHPEHLAVAHALAHALAAVPHRLASLRLRAFEIQVPLTSRLANLVLDTTASQARWRAAMGAYQTQAATLRSAFRQRRYAGRAQGSKGSAERFWEMDAQRYLRLHQDSPDQWPRVFRGLRSWPFTDPLAYLVGARERRRLMEDSLAAR